MASEAEQKEIDDLTQLITTGSSVRESPITASKYNRWLVGEQNRGAGRVVREEVNHLNNARIEFRTRHKEYGQSLKEAGHEQLRRDQEKQEMTRQNNLAKGQLVKAEVIAQKAQEEKQKEEWIAHGRTLGKRAQIQKSRIRDVVGADSKRVAEMAAKTKQEELDYERELAGVRAKLLKDNQAEVEKVRTETADEVIDAAKEFAFEQRKSLAFTTKAAEVAWKDERDKNTKSFLDKAYRNKADAKASRQRAKELREEIESTRREVANMARKQQQSNKEQKDKIIMFASGGIKDTHDQIFRKKYVPQEAAAKLQNSKYAGTVS